MSVSVAPAIIPVAGSSFVRPVRSGDGIRLYGSSSGYVGIKSASAAGSVDYTLPSADGSSGYVLSTNGSGTLSWIAVTSSSPGGSGTELQYRNGSSFGAISGSSWDGTSLTLPNSVLITSRALFNSTALYVGGSTSTSSTPSAGSIYGIGGSGTNIAGGNLILAPGKSTGSATPASVVIQGTAAGSSGATSQTLVDCITVNAGASVGTTVNASATNTYISAFTQTGTTAGMYFKPNLISLYGGAGWYHNVLLHAFASDNNYLCVQAGVNSSFSTSRCSLMVGSQSRQMFFGVGSITSNSTLQHATPADVLFGATSGSGTNIAGASFTFAAGRGTGTGVGGNLVFQTSVAGSSGTSLNSLSTAMSIAGTSPNVTITQLATTHVGLSLAGIASGSGDLLQANPSGVTAGQRARITSAGDFSNNGGSATTNEMFGSGTTMHATANETTYVGGGITGVTGDGSVAIGYGAAPGGSHCTLVGAYSIGTGFQFGTGVGRGCKPGFYATVMGYSAQAFGSNPHYSIVLGYNSTANHASSIVIGTSVASTTTNQLVISCGTGTTETYIGLGVTNASPVSTTRIQGTGGSGTNIAATSLLLAPGKSTGSATPAVVKLQGTTAGSSGTTAQTLADVVVITNSTTVDISSGVTVQGGVSKPTSLVQTEVTSTPSGTTQTIDWTTGNFQTLTLSSASGNVTLTFTAPAASANLRLLIVQGGTARDITFPASVKWDSLGAPTWTGDANTTRWVTFTYNGTNYFASASEQYT